LIGILAKEELLISTLAAKLNAYGAELCHVNTQKIINSKVDFVTRKDGPS
jgi:peptide-methionine (S)-S-oxide reductase